MNKRKPNVKLMCLVKTKLLSSVFLSEFPFGYYDGRNFILLGEKLKQNLAIKRAFIY